MGLDYVLRCRKCWDVWEEENKLCEMEGKDLNEPEFDLDMYHNPINTRKMISWLLIHRQHGEIDFVIEP